MVYTKDCHVCIYTIQLQSSQKLHREAILICQNIVRLPSEMGSFVKEGLGMKESIQEIRI